MAPPRSAIDPESQNKGETRGVANFGENFEKSEIGVQFFFFTWGFFFHYQGAKKQCFVAFPSQSQAVVGDIRKNGQTFSDLNFHKI